MSLATSVAQCAECPAHLDGLKTLEALRLPEGLEHRIHQNRLLKRAREGAQMTAQHLRDLESTRRHATRVADVYFPDHAKVGQSFERSGKYTSARHAGCCRAGSSIDNHREIIDLHDRIMGRLFNWAKHSHAQQFQESGKTIHEKMRWYGKIGTVLLAARTEGTDAFSAIEALISWETFAKIVTATQDLTPREFDDLHRIGDGDAQVRRYAPALLDALQMKVAPAAQDVLSAVETLKTLNAENARKVPQDVPTRFVRKRWESLVFKAEGVDRRFYELCTLSALKNALRSGDLWVQGSRQFKDFGDDL